MKAPRIRGNTDNDPRYPRLRGTPTRPRPWARRASSVCETPARPPYHGRSATGASRGDRRPAIRATRPQPRRSWPLNPAGSPPAGTPSPTPPGPTRLCTRSPLRPLTRSSPLTRRRGRSRDSPTARPGLPSGPGRALLAERVGMAAMTGPVRSGCGSTGTLLRLLIGVDRCRTALLTVAMSSWRLLVRSRVPVARPCTGCCARRMRALPRRRATRRRRSHPDRPHRHRERGDRDGHEGLLYWTLRRRRRPCETGADAFLPVCLCPSIPR